MNYRAFAATLAISVASPLFAQEPLPPEIISKVSYAIGMDIARQLAQQPEANRAKALKGFQDAMAREVDTDAVLYAEGVGMAAQLGRRGLTLEQVLKAIQDQQSGAQPAYTMEELRDANQKAQLFMQAQEMEMQRRQQEQQQEALQSSETNLKLGKEFLEKNAGKEGVMTTLSGLQYQVLKAAEGPKPAATDTVRVHYTGRLLNGTVFDSSVERGEPVEFPLNGVIPGWTEGLQLMSVGSKFRLWIPASLAYGARGRPGIGPNQVLEFEVELLEIK